MEDYEENTNGHGCGCGPCGSLSSFLRLRKKSKTVKGGWILLKRQEVTIKEGGVQKRARKVKEFSKVLSACGCKYWKKLGLIIWDQQEERANYHYDAKSYALNFDNGENGDHLMEPVAIS